MPNRDAAAAVASPPLKAGRPKVAFHDKYPEQCRQRNAPPLAAVLKGRPHNSLDFYADRVRVDEWLDVLHVLPADRCLERVAIRLRKRGTRGS